MVLVPVVVIVLVIGASMVVVYISCSFGIGHLVSVVVVVDVVFVGSWDIHFLLPLRRTIPRNSGSSLVGGRLGLHRALGLLLEG